MADSGEFKYVIEIKIDSDGGSNNSGSSSGTGGSANLSNTTAKNNPSTGDMIKKFAPVAVAGKTLLNFATSNIGTFTGNQRLQDQVNTGLKAVGYGALLVTNPVMGAVALGTDLITSAITYNFNQKWKDREIEQARFRVGYTTTNRSK